jgi:hypothetical protein
MKANLLTAAAIITMLGLYAQASQWDHENYAEEERMYCKMVAINKADPDKGWPHYNKDIECE